MLNAFRSAYIKPTFCRRSAGRLASPPTTIMSAFVPSSAFPVLSSLRSTSCSSRTLRRARPTAPTRSAARVASTPRCAADQPSSDPQPPSGAVLCGALEVSFRNVWLRLMTTGVGPAYNQAIRAFVLAAAASYKAGYSLTALKFELSTHEKRGVVMGQDIQLNDDEKRTRTIWLALVYATLSRYRFPTERGILDARAELSQSELSEMAPTIFSLVDAVCDAAQRGYDLQRFKLERNLVKDQDSPPEDADEASIRSQWARIVFSTLDLLPGELTGISKT